MRTLSTRSAALAIGGALGATLLLPSAALAHGAHTAPGSRSYLCYTDGRWTGGDLDPRNAACKKAIAVGGKQPFWDWFGVLRSDGAGRMKGFIPDGQLCGGGSPKYAGLNLARSDWPVTHLTSGSRSTVRYRAWAAHPGTFRLFITKDGYRPTKKLAWSDLESVPFSTWKEKVPNGVGEYSWRVKWPANKTGQRIVYSVWQRSDSTETFYGCSDVKFDGGHGQVTGFPKPPAPGPGSELGDGGTDTPIVATQPMNDQRPAHEHHKMAGHVARKAHKTVKARVSAPVSVPVSVPAGKCAATSTTTACEAEFLTEPSNQPGSGPGQQPVAPTYDSKGL
jgi:predicted carbohydrate-binding protein with CBM5 and CBM33 domain